MLNYSLAILPPTSAITLDQKARSTGKLLAGMLKRLLGAIAIVAPSTMLLFCFHQLLIHTQHNVPTYKASTGQPVPASESDLNLRIISITMNRAISLQRLLNSLNDAHYFNDVVVLDIWIDRSNNGTVDMKTLEVANSFNFLHGSKYVHIQPSHAGVYGQLIYTWNVSDQSPEIAIILDDDLQVSPFFYKWLKMVHSKYDNYDNINAYSLHGRCENHALIGSKNRYIVVPKTETVFLYPAFNTWGFSPHKKHWLHFVNWVTLKKNDTKFKPSIEKIEPSNWYTNALNEGKEADYWDFLHLYHAHIHKLFTMYPNLQGDRGLSIHWKEKGLHYQENKDKTPSGDLLLNWIPGIESLPDKPLYLDFAGRHINPNNIQWP